MTKTATNPVRLWHWLPKASTVQLIGWMFALAAASVSAADGISTDASSEGPALGQRVPAQFKRTARPQAVVE